MKSSEVLIAISLKGKCSATDMHIVITHSTLIRKEGKDEIHHCWASSYAKSGAHKTIQRKRQLIFSLFRNFIFTFEGNSQKEK